MPTTSEYTATLYYVHDPMCSWCWAFRPVWKEIKDALPSHIKVVYLLGGLAPDSSDPMQESMQNFLQKTWQKIQTTVPGTEFNFDFWTNCKPRRSTYPSCRAIIAARNQNAAMEEAMIEAIQKAYYLKAINPSDDENLINLAVELGLDKGQFIKDLSSPQTQQQLQNEINQHQQIGAQGFPSVIVEKDNSFMPVAISYTDASLTISIINKHY